MVEKMSCGHPADCVVSDVSDFGGDEKATTSYCGWCADLAELDSLKKGAKAKEEALDELVSAREKFRERIHEATKRIDQALALCTCRPGFCECFGYSTLDEIRAVLHYNGPSKWEPPAIKDLSHTVQFEDEWDDDEFEE